MSDLPEHIRAFLAVRIPDAVRAQLAEVQRQLKPELRDVSWTRAEAMHLTLQFLGNIESARLTDLTSALRGSVRDHGPFEVALGALGSFGDRVLWIGLAHGEEPLKNLANAVRRATQAFAGHDENCEFNAHVTLGRIRRRAQGVAAALEKIRLPKFQSWNATEFELIRSELSPNGSRYTTLATIDLRKGK